MMCGDGSAENMQMAGASEVCVCSLALDTFFISKILEC